MRRREAWRAALSLPAALLALAGLAGAGQAAAPAAKLAKACIEERTDELLSAGRKLLEEDRDRLAEAAEARPRAFELPALIYIRQGKLAAARDWYGKLLGRLPEESTSAGLYREALGLLQTQIGLAETSDSRYARAGYSYVGSLRDIEGSQGRTYALVIWRKSPCGFKVPGIADDARAELFETAAGRRLVRRDEIDPAQGLIEPDAILVQGPDGDPMVSLHVYTGGDCWDCGYRRVFRISGGSLEEITLPKDSPGPIHRAEDLDADGIPEFLVFDGRWQSYRKLCWDCSPSVAAVYRLKNGKAVEACDRFPGYYQEQIAEAEAALDNQTEFDLRARWAVGAYLSFIQIGDIDAARKFLRKQLPAPGRGYSYKDAQRADEMVADLQRQLARVERLLSRPCSVLDMTAGDRKE